jgi:NADH dehydrogenase FAD-containing subunit
MVRIVIVGAGSGGVACAQALAKTLKPSDQAEVVVLEKNAFFYHAVGVPRAFVDAGFASKLFVPLKNAIPASAAAFVRIERALVTEISEKQVAFHRISDDDSKSPTMETITFDYLVLSPGSSYNAPIKPELTVWSRAVIEAQLKHVREQIEGAQSILIVGGGAVGCEVAGEIKAKHPSKSVTLLEGRETLVANNAVRDKFRAKLMVALEKRLGVRVIVGERLKERLTENGFEKGSFSTDKGTTIESDIQLVCAGFRPATQLVKDLDAALIDDKTGAVRVNAQLQIDDARFHNVFVLGDASNHPTPKLGFWAGEQAKFLAKELTAAVRSKPGAFTKPFPKVEVEAMLLPLGPNGGVGQLPVMGGTVVGDGITRAIKGKDMFAGMAWKSLGSKLPA